MITLRQPPAHDVARYRADRERDEPTFSPGVGVPDGFHATRVVERIGYGDADFASATSALRSWSAHAGAGVRVAPPGAALQVGTTVAILTRQLGLWILAACRITDVVDTPTTLGFTYATLPDHPECGEESFRVEVAPDDSVLFRIDATWRSDAWLARLGFPVAKWLQQRATDRYLDAMAVSTSPSGMNR